MPRRSSRRSASTRRGTSHPHIPPADRKQLYIFTEGEVTDLQCINPWLRWHRDVVSATIDERHGRGPKELVELAVQKKREDSRLVKRGKQSPYDEYWCVADVDEHRNVPGAIEQAAHHGIHVALSNPCVELWLLLHVKDQIRSIDRYEAQRMAHREGLVQGKRLTDRAVEIFDRYDAAAKRAQALASKHQGDGSDGGCHANPSSTMWQLVDSIRGHDDRWSPEATR